MGNWPVGSDLNQLNMLCYSSFTTLIKNASKFTGEYFHDFIMHILSFRTSASVEAENLESAACFLFCE